MPEPLIALLAAAAIAGVGAILCWPDRGVIPRWRRARLVTERTRAEDAVKHLYESEMNGILASVQSLAGALHLTLDDAADVLGKLQVRNLVQVDRGQMRLTEAGRRLGLHVLRAHRLWERYLADRTGFPEVEWHGRAHDLEHTVSPAEAEALSARLRHPTYDPHGDPIPTAEGEFPQPQGVPLTAAGLDRPLCIVHIEDEPETVYAQLVALGLHPGMRVRLSEIAPQRVRLWTDEEEHVLAPVVAASVFVVHLAEEEQVEEAGGEPLSGLRPGEEGEVVHISRRCRGQERRRLMDLGVLPGTLIHAQMASPSGDPTAYRVRDALIALRAEQAQLIRIRRVPAAAASGASRA